MYDTWIRSRFNRIGALLWIERSAVPLIFERVPSPHGPPALQPRRAFWSMLAKRRKITIDDVMYRLLYLSFLTGNRTTKSQTRPRSGRDCIPTIQTHSPRPPLPHIHICTRTHAFDAIFSSHETKSHQPTSTLPPSQRPTPPPWPAPSLPAPAPPPSQSPPPPLPPPRPPETPRA